MDHIAIMKVTPLALAAIRGHIDAVKLLIKHGADVNIHFKCRYHSPWMELPLRTV